MTRWRGAVEAATLVTSLVLVGGCGGVEQTEGARQGTTVQVATPTEFADLISKGYIVDMEPLKSVEDLIDSSTVAIRGNIARVLPGRVIETSDGLLVRKTLLMVVDVADVYKGELRVVTHSRMSK